MRILITNDDGILAEGLWTLVRELKNIAQVTVVVPDRERSGIGTAVTLRQVLRVQKVNPRVPEIETYSIDGTPSDSVLLALGKLVKDRIDLVISGINQGQNLGEDVHISGTVGAALQGNLYGLPALAISSAHGNSHSLDIAAKVAMLLVKKMAASPLPTNIFLNVNIPGLEPTSKISGVKITRLARESHINTIEKGDDGRQEYYWLLRREMDETEKSQDSKTDIGAVKEGNISITPLNTNWFNKPPLQLLNDLCSDLLEELKILGLAG